MKAQRRFGHTWLLWLEPEENHVLNLAVDGFRAILLGSDDSTSGSVMELNDLTWPDELMGPGELMGSGGFMGPGSLLPDDPAHVNDSVHGAARPGEVRDGEGLDDPADPDDPFQLWERQMTQAEGRAIGGLHQDAFPDDPEQNERFHRRHDDELRNEHLADLDAVQRDLRALADGPLKINDEVLLRWIRTFSTARVGIAQWLGIVDEASASMVEESAAQGILAPQYGVYEWLGYVTEFLVEMLQQDG